MTDKKKNRRSKVELLPLEIRDQLNRMIRDGEMLQIDIVDAVNKLIASKGLPDDQQLSKSGFNRYAKRMEDIGAKIRQSREVAEVWTAKLGSAPTSDVGKLLQEVVRTLAFETSMNMAEEGKPAEPKAISQLALAIQRVEQAAMASHKRETEIRKAFATEAANAVSEELRGEDGMSEQLEDKIRNILLGKA
jgi:hypothetical protein